MRRAIAIGIVALALTLATPGPGQAALINAPHALKGEGAKETKNEPVLLTADKVEYSQDQSIVTASGHVEASQGDRVLLADTVSYNQKTGVVTASGHVSLLEPTGEVVFADYAELTNDMKDGIIHDLKIRLSDNSRMAAAGGRREGGVVTEMRKGVFSPCDVCKDQPKKPPLWQLRADKIVHNNETHDIKYYDAFLDMYGLPVFYTPYMSMPDPTVKRRTGFLAPSYGNSSDLGFIAGVPYYIVLDDSSDVTVRPIITEKQGPVLASEYRQRFTHGALDLQGSITDADFTDSSGTVEHNDLRGHIFGKGRFDLDDMWRTGFDLARASDDTYLARYNFSYPDNVLTTRGFLEGYDNRNYASLESYLFQGLRPTDTAKTTPLVAPLMNYNYFGYPNSHGAYFTLDTNLMSLSRVTGVDSNRISLKGGWHLPYTGEGGDVFEATIMTQGDLYYVSDVPDPANPGSNTNGVTGRFFPQLGLDWRYPLVRMHNTQRQMIEPMAAIVVGPSGSNPDKIPNEDSQAIEFDDADLFSMSRFPGIDRVEGGQRVDYGVNGGIYGPRGSNVTAFLGQSYRLERASSFDVGSGLEDQLSDIVGRLQFTPHPLYDIFYRFRLDKDHVTPNSEEVSLNLGPQVLRLNTDYLFLAEKAGIGGFTSREQLSVQLSSKLTDYWTVMGQTVQDLTGQGALSYRADLKYDDECFTMYATYLRRLFTNAEIRPSNTILFQFIFKRLGEVRT